VQACLKRITTDSEGDDAEEDYENLVIPHTSSSSDSEDSAAAMPPSIKTVW
jgi:hypothetical protein